MKNKGMTFLISVCVFCSFMAGRLYETVSMLDKIAVEAEKHKQRFYDEGYAEGTKIYIDPNDEGILVGTGPTDAYNIGAGSYPDQAQYLPRDYSNYSDPYMLSQGASYNTDPNIMGSLEVSDPNLIGCLAWVDANGVFDCTDNAIQDLVKRGRVCDVIGHRWKEETSLWPLGDYSYSVTPASHDASSILNYGSIVDGYYTYNGSTSETRTCDLCGVKQVKVVKWEVQK